MTRPRTLLLPLLLATPASAQNWFDSPRYLLDVATFPGAEGITRILAPGDFDGDGDVDLVGLASAGLVPMRNDGTGEFEPLGPVALADGAAPDLSPARVGDLNGDGFQDVVLLGVLPGNVQIYHGRGDGGLAPPVVVPLPENPGRFDLGDFDGDGADDIALALGGSVGWLYDDGTGYQSSPLLNVGGIAWGIVAADLDGDGLDDIALGLQALQEVYLVLTQGGEPVLSQVLPVAGDLNASPVPYAGDLDGDGDVDVLSLTYSSGFDLEMTPLLNDGAGQLSVAASQVYPTLGESLNVSAAHLADWDADGDADLAALSILGVFSTFPEEATLLENGGGAAFGTPVKFPVGQTGIAPGLADLDGDGHLDFALFDGVYFGDGTFRRPIAGSDDLLGFPVDREGDGDVDFVLLGGTGYTNDGTGTYASELLLPPSPGPDQFYRPSVVFADLDGDGFRDLLSALIFQEDIFQAPELLGMRLLRDDSSLTYVDSGLAAPPATEIPHGDLSAAVDLDGDGDLDVTTADTVASVYSAWLNDGTGYFPDPAVPLFAGLARDHGDVDADGDVDFLSKDLQVGFSPLDLQRNLGGLAFQTTPLFDPPDPGQILQTNFRLLDLDLDGDLDAVVGVEQNTFGQPENVFFLENDGAGNFGAATLVASAGEDIEHIGLGDVDGDGASDLLATARPTDTAIDRVLVWRRVTGGSALEFEEPRRWTSRAVVAFEDVDGDGDVDAAGDAIVRSRAFVQPENGLVRQYGTAVAGTGGARPVLGAVGPFREGESDIELRLRRGVGGTFGALLFGTFEVAIPNFGVPGLTGYVLPLFAPVGVSTRGASGAPGAGEWTLPVPPPGPALVGQSFFHQVFLVDAQGPFGFTASNGLEIRYGE